MSGTSGTVSLSLPVGNYSVTALGFVGSTLYAGIGELAASTLSPNQALVLSLEPAIRLTGTVSTAGPSSNATRTAVIAYAADGSPAYTWVTNGSYAFYLPAGSVHFSLLSRGRAPRPEPCTPPSVR